MYVAEAKRLTLAGAKKMMATATAKAEEAGIAISVAIVDAGGHAILVERMDGGRFHTVHSATTKAVCAASNKRPTTAQGAQGQPLDTRARDRARARCRAWNGGPRWRAAVPILVDGECIGGIGVSGGNFEFDERVAREAVASIGAK